MKIQLISIALICSLCLPNTAWASSVGTAAVRGAEKSLARGLRRPANRLRAFDALRDRKSHLSILRGQRSVDRYTSARTAGSERKLGIPANRHMTSSSSSKPLTAGNAKIRLGLERRPDVVERIEIPKGTSLHFNKVVGGKAGYGEITAASRLPKSSIKKILKLHP